jgi:DNA-binding transcriptional MerR regulator
MSYLYTSELARFVGVHPNTVRRYVERGILPPVERSPAGYRRFTQRHLDCLRLACLAYRGPYPGKAIFDLGAQLTQAVVEGDLAEALELARRRLELMQAERAHADLAAALLERWADQANVAPDDALPGGATAQSLRIGQVARLLGVSIDVVRGWDRNGLIDIPRDPQNGYRRYGARQISRLRIIRMLSRAGFSTAAILRMLIQLDSGETANLRHALDTPRPDEDVYLASDRWLSALAEQEQRSHAMIALIEELSQRQAPSSDTARAGS